MCDIYENRILIVLIIFMALFPIIAQTDSIKPETILKLPPNTQNADTLGNNNQKLPASQIPFTAEQDSAFNIAMRLGLPLRTLINNNLRYSDDIWNMERRLAEDTPWQIALQNIRSIPPEFYRADPVDVVHRQIAIEQSMYVPFMTTYPRYGTKISLEAIGRLLGLVEDFSPEIKYSLDYTSEVEVVIYSISSVVISTLFNGKQTPGSYKLTWNGRDDRGKLMPPGDYIAEVRIGNERFIRKRIIIR